MRIRRRAALQLVATAVCVLVIPAHTGWPSEVKIRRSAQESLGPLGSVAITVRDDSGAAVAGVAVALFGAPPLSYMATTDSRGLATFPALTPGRYRLSLEPPPATNLAIERADFADAAVVEVRSGQLTKLAFPLEKAGRLVIKTVRNDGSAWPALDPAAGAAIWVSGTNPETGRSSVGAFFRPWDLAPDGSAILSGLVPASGVQLILRSHGYREVRVPAPDVRAGEVVTVTVTIDPADPTGVEGIAEPFSDVVVQRVDSPDIGAETSADGSGRYAVAGLAPGQYRVRILGVSEFLVTVVQGQRRATAPTKALTQPSVDNAAIRSTYPPLGVPMPWLTMCPDGWPLPWTDPYYEPTKVAIRRALQAVDQCLASSPTCRNRVVRWLQRQVEVRMHCPPERRSSDSIVCGSTWNQIVWVYDSPLSSTWRDPFDPVNTKVDVCGCVEGTIFHEFFHHSRQVADECAVCQCTKHCLPCAAGCEDIMEADFWGVRKTGCTTTPDPGQAPPCCDNGCR